MRRIKPWITLLVAFGLAACGGSGGTSTSTSTSTSASGNARNGRSTSSSDRTSYVARADALCKSANIRQEVLRRKARGLRLTRLPPILRQQAAIAAALSTDLGRLTPPSGDRAAVGRFVRAVRQLSVFSRAVANSIAAGHAFAARALAGKLSVARQQETLLGQGYGYKTCSSGKSY